MFFRRCEALFLPPGFRVVGEGTARADKDQPSAAAHPGGDDLIYGGGSGLHKVITQDRGFDVLWNCALRGDVRSEGKAQRQAVFYQRHRKSVKIRRERALLKGIELVFAFAFEFLRQKAAARFGAALFFGPQRGKELKALAFKGPVAGDVVRRAALVQAAFGKKNGQGDVCALICSRFVRQAAEQFEGAAQQGSIVGGDGFCSFGVAACFVLLGDVRLDAGISAQEHAPWPGTDLKILHARLQQAGDEGVDVTLFIHFPTVRRAVLDGVGQKENGLTSGGGDEGSVFHERGLEDALPDPPFVHLRCAGGAGPDLPDQRVHARHEADLPHGGNDLPLGIVDRAVGGHRDRKALSEGSGIGPDAPGNALDGLCVQFCLEGGGARRGSRAFVLGAEGFPVFFFVSARERRRITCRGGQLRLLDDRALRARVHGPFEPLGQIIAERRRRHEVGDAGIVDEFFSVPVALALIPMGLAVESAVQVIAVIAPGDAEHHLTDIACLRVAVQPFGQAFVQPVHQRKVAFRRIGRIVVRPFLKAGPFFGDVTYIRHGKNLPI